MRHVDRFLYAPEAGRGHQPGWRMASRRLRCRVCRCAIVLDRAEAGTCRVCERRAAREADRRLDELPGNRRVEL